MADESFFKADVYGLGITLAESLSGRAKLAFPALELSSQELDF
jgi:hypothetical protein